jgi:hypothetical protein
MWQQAEARRMQAHSQFSQQMAARMNFLLDMASLSAGVPIEFPRIHTPQPVYANVTGGPVLNNNIRIDRSVVGMLNTGSIQDVQRIDINLKTLIDSGSSTVANSLKLLTENVARAQELSEIAKTELLEQLQLISEQAALPADHRKTSIVKPVLSSLVTGISTVSSLARLWAVVGEYICSHLGVANPFKQTP